jgi:uncharacterized protein YbbK (DUF523 family)
VSGCLAGLKVRYDGRDKRHTYLLDTLSQHLQLQPVCPEAAIGLGIPRPPIQLVQVDNSNVGDSNVIARGRADPTLQPGPALRHFGDTLGRVHAQSWCGFICQSRSPSCGYGSTPIYQADTETTRLGNGLFIDSLQQAMPWLPILEDTELENPARVVQFLQRCRLVQQGVR